MKFFILREISSSLFMKTIRNKALSKLYIYYFLTAGNYIIFGLDIEISKKIKKFLEIKIYNFKGRIRI